MKVLLFTLFIFITNTTPAQIIEPFQELKGDNDGADQVFTKVEITSQYIGGENAWRAYLKKNLKYPFRPDSVVSVEVQFIVDKNGIVSEIKALSGETSFRKVAERLVSNSGFWRPANMCGRNVKSYHRSTIIFTP